MTKKSRDKEISGDLNELEFEVADTNLLSFYKNRVKENLIRYQTNKSKFLNSKWGNALIAVVLVVGVSVPIYVTWKQSQGVLSQQAKIMDIQKDVAESVAEAASALENRAKGQGGSPTGTGQASPTAGSGSLSPPDRKVAMGV